MNFNTRWNRKPFDGEALDPTKLDTLDDLRPYSVGEMIQRFTVAGENLAGIRRKELASFRGEVDDPDDLRTPLDSSEADLVTAHYLAEEIARKKKANVDDKSTVDQPETTHAVESASGNDASEPAVKA